MKNKTLLQVVILSCILATTLSSQCSITNLFAEVSECNMNGVVSIDFEFDVEDPGDSNMFDLQINGVLAESYEYGELFYTYGSVQPDCETTYTIEIIDQNNNDCSDSYTFDEAFCCASCDNFIVDYVGSNECTGSGTYFAEILIKNPGSTNFEVIIDGISQGIFGYGEEVYTFGPYTGDCITEHTFEVIDLDLECTATIVLEPVCCPEYCSISNITVEEIECNGDNQFSIEVNFDYSEVDEDVFDLWANGSYHGTYAYADLPIIIEDFPQQENGIPFITIFGTGADELCADDLAFDGLDCSTTECNISNVYAEAYECNDQGQIFVDIEFDVSNPGPSNQFTINGNGTTYETFEYGQTFYTVGPFTPDCDLEYEFEVRDVDNNDCYEYYIFSDPLCCEEGACEITTLDFGPDPICQNGNIFTEWLIDGVNLSEVGFDIFINNEFQDYVEWNDDSWYDFDITDPGTEYFTIKVCDNDNEDCCIEWELENPCYEASGDECSITDVEAEAICTDDGLFADIWFTYDNPGSSNQFYIDVNGQEFGPFEYGETFYNVGPIDFPCDQAQFINVTDADNPDCSGFLNLELEEGFCCDENNCTITNVGAEAYECNEEGEIYFDIFFDIDNPGADNQFTVVGNGNDYGTFEYGEDYYTVGPFEADCATLAELIITDLNENNCSAVIVFDEVFCCEDEGECEITTLDFGANPVCENGLISTEWLIDGSNLSEVGFDIFINNEFETFVQWNNDSWYEFDIEDPEIEVFTIKVCDNDNENCCIEIDIENPCESDQEECMITEVEINALCDGTSTYFELNFEYTNNSAATFEVTVNDDYTESFPYEDLPVWIYGLNYETDFITVTITDIEDSECNYSTEFNNPCFENGDPECGIFDLIAEATECNDDGDVYFDISFYVNNAGDDNQFTVVGNGNDYGTFEYGEEYYTIGPFEADCETIAELIISDVNNDDCSSIWVFDEIFCCDDEPEECSISEVVVEALECNDNNQVYFHLTFNYENVGDDYQFTVIGNGNDFGTFEYGLDYYEIGPVEADCETELEFIVSDVNNNCTAFVGHDPVCCDDEDDCPLFELSVEITECLDNNTFNLTIDIEVVGDSNNFFDLVINDEFIGFYEFANLPLTLEDLSYDSEYITIQVCENDNPDCCLIIDVYNPCYDSEGNGEDADCYIDDIELDNSNCEDGEFSITLDFDYGTGNSEEINVSANGEDYGTYAYEELPITLDGFEGGETLYEFVITDSEDENCTGEIVSSSVDCDPTEMVNYAENQTDLFSNGSLDLRLWNDIISIEIYDVHGNKIKQIQDFSKIIDLDRSVSSGILILRIETTTDVLIKKIVRVR